MWPFRHFGLKLVALGLAVLLWMAVAGEETVERGLRVPLELQQLPVGIELSGEIPTAVDVRVRGASGALSRIGAGDVVAVLDLRGARAGRRLFPLAPDQVRAPVGVDIVQVTPSAIALVFEPSLTRTVPVAPSVDGRPAPGFVVATLKANPAQVDIAGPEAAVRRATEALTEPVLIAGARDRVEETVSIGMLDPTLRIINARTAVVTVQMEPAPLERTFRAQPVHLRNVAPNVIAQASPSLVDVTLRGSRETLARVTADEIAAYVDVGGLGAGVYSLDVRAQADRDAGVTRIQPSIVQVQITRGQE